MHVVRNEPFELVAAVLGPFLAYAGLEADITYGPYDDSLSDPGAGLPASCDAVIVWMDMERYGTDLAPGQLVGWVAERVSALRPLTEAPVLVANWGSQSERAVSYNTALVGRLGALTGVYICDQGALALELGLGYTDARMSAVSGSRLSDRAILETARAFGLRWLPAVLVAPVKAIVVDLDHTLYRGVLSEEGVDGIELSEDHRALHRELLACRSRGAYLALASKNDAADVDALFAGRADLDLRPEHFSARAVSWSSKADGIASIADELRIWHRVDAVRGRQPGRAGGGGGPVPGARGRPGDEPGYYGVHPAPVPRAVRVPGQRRRPARRRPGRRPPPGGGPGGGRRGPRLPGLPGNEA